MRHNTTLMQSRLPIHQQRIPSLQMPVHRLPRRQQIRLCFSLVQSHLFQNRPIPIFILNYIRTWMLLRSIDHQLLHLHQVIRRHRLRERQFLRHENWDPDLISCDVGVW